MGPTVYLRARVLMEEARALGLDLADMVAADTAIGAQRPTVGAYIEAIAPTFLPAPRGGRFVSHDVGREVTHAGHIGWATWSSSDGRPKGLMPSAFMPFDLG